MSLHAAPLTDQKELLTKTIITNYFFILHHHLPNHCSRATEFPRHYSRF